MSNNEERMMTLYHGTTVARAQQIASRQEFSNQDSYFTSPAHRDLAEFFARRSASRHPAEGGPALVLVQLPEDEFNRLWKTLRLLRLTGFSEGDRPDLRGRNQWVLEAGGVIALNHAIEEWEWERVN